MCSVNRLLIPSDSSSRRFEQQNAEDRPNKEDERLTRWRGRSWWHLPTRGPVTSALAIDGDDSLRNF